MRTFVIVLSLVAAASAQYPNSRFSAPSAYGVPQQPFFGGPELPGNAIEEEEPIRTVKHVFVHVAPDDESSGQARIIKAPIPRERQVSILFVKAPAPAAPDQQIVDIPNDGGKKTLVYVLLKKADATPDVGFKTPPPTQPSKPEIYFIRYKDGQKPAGTPGQLPVGGGAPIPVRSGGGANAQYGVPAAPLARGGY